MKTPLSTDSETTETIYGNELEWFKEFNDLQTRLTKTLYYGDGEPEETSSLPLSDIAVKFFTDSTPQQLDQIDVHLIGYACSKRTRLSSCSFVLAMIYLDRLKQQNPQYVQSMSSSKLFVVSMLLASKFLYDDEQWEWSWAKETNMDLAELKKLELEFLDALDWQVFVDVRVFQDLLHQIESKVAVQEGLKRGWFSYTDLQVLSKNLNRKECLSLLLDSILKVTVVCAIAYTAGVLTLVGASYIVGTGLASVEPTAWEFLSNSVNVPWPPSFRFLPSTDFALDNDSATICHDFMDNSNHNNGWCSSPTKSLSSSKFSCCCGHVIRTKLYNSDSGLDNQIPKLVMEKDPNTVRANSSSVLARSDHDKDVSVSSVPVLSFVPPLDFSDRPSVPVLSECLQPSWKSYQDQWSENRTTYPVCNPVPLVVR